MQLRSSLLFEGKVFLGSQGTRGKIEGSQISSFGHIDLQKLF